MPEELIQIKRYPNRRFYDRNASKYISLEDIERLVLNGKRVEIRDSQAGEEITRSVLTRILLERQPDKMLLFPKDMLHFILRANEVSTGFLSEYFQHSLTYLNYLSKHGSTSSALAQPMHWVKAWLDSMVPQPATNDESTHEPEDENKESRLSSRIEQLEERIRQLESQGD